MSSDAVCGQAPSCASAGRLAGQQMQTTKIANRRGWSGTADMAHSGANLADLGHTHTLMSIGQNSTHSRQGSYWPIASFRCDASILPELRVNQTRCRGQTCDARDPWRRRGQRCSTSALERDAERLFIRLLERLCRLRAACGALPLLPRLIPLLRPISLLRLIPPLRLLVLVAAPAGIVRLGVPALEKEKGIKACVGL